MNVVEIIRRAQDGDEKAYEIIYKEHYKTAYFYALKVCKNESDAQDIAQEAMLDVRRYLPSLRNPDYFRPWLYQIVAHLCSKMFRKEKHVRNNGEITGGMGMLIREERQDHMPESLMHFQSDKEVLLHFIDKLPEQQRSVIVLFYLEQFSIKEIAEIMKTPEGTVKSRMATARKTLFKELQKYQKENDAPLTFQAMDALLLSAMSMAFQSLQVAPLTMTVPHLGNVISTKFAQSSFFVKAAIVGCTSFVGVGGIVLADQYYNQPKEQAILSLDQKVISSMEFPTIHYQNQTISSARDAYFVLLKFACCEDEFNRKSKEEIEAIHPVYEAYEKAQAENKVANMKVSWEASFIEKTK